MIMKKRRIPKVQTVRLIAESNYVKIGEEMNGQMFFEIGNEITYDVAEAVAILMRMDSVDDIIWNSEFKIDYDIISPRKSLYWLSGGNNEWVNPTNYNREWTSCDFEFEEEFGFIVISALKRARNLRQVKEEFIRYLNLHTFYEFALARGFLN